MQKRWHILSPDPKQVSMLAESLGCRPAVATVLTNRGICSPDRATAFLKPSLARVRSPFLMKDTDRAVERILLAILRREKVLVCGDYDVDGITATALLFEFLSYLDADVRFYIPNRLTEGYGLSLDCVEKCAIPDNIGLIITVDCGISSHEAVSAARRAGIDVIITDHHEIPSQMPDALAVLNPKRPDCPSGFSWLAGVGVAFNLVLALRKRLRDEGFWNSRLEPNLKAACDLVALGTVADMVPLVEENRIYVKAGLEVLSSDVRPGVKALLDVSNMPDRPLDTREIAFRIAPRLNAAGRLRNGSIALKLLMTSDTKIAHAIAEELNQENTRRQEIENLILSDITQHLEDNPRLLKQRALVLDRPGWHEGVVGIVASRLVNRYCRPVVVIAVADGIGKGSARSPDGFDVYEGLKSCSQYLEKFGGHKAAAGLTLRAENIPAFSKKFERIVCEKTIPEDFVPKLVIDSEISVSDICTELVDELEALAPFGTGNPEPLFMLSDIDVLSARMVGAHHLQMRLRSSKKHQTKPLDAIFFNTPSPLMPRSGRQMGAAEPHPKHLNQIACHIRWNRWKDRKRIQLVIRDLEPG
ncbi:MAG: single-stranded-DNA-specific exonuclease RecJ [Deltaproteobacteria bacterium]|nr:single-stranded-DNA-specific exonuclease RecJ [Deltaproteobacteria bacterium]RLB82806.1 MAG: single-stranded-DNA-specific exonuclease RecJ [Deltaproteobacteria bacterium]